MLRIVVAALSASFVAVPAFAESTNVFRNEISPSYIRQTTNIDLQATTFAIDVEHYFDYVDTRSHPLAEAAFLEHASGVSLNMFATSIDDEGASGGETGIAVGVRYVLDAVPLAFLAGAGGSELTADGSDNRFGTSVIGAGLGVYATPGTFVGMKFSRTHEELSSSGAGVLEQEFLNEFGLNAKSVFGIGAESAFTVTAEWSRTVPDGDANTEVAAEIGLQYYPNRETSIGVGFTKNDAGGDGDSHSQLIFVQWFFTPAASLNLGYGQLSIDNAGPDEVDEQTSFLLGLTGRL